MTMKSRDVWVWSEEERAARKGSDWIINENWRRNGEFPLDSAPLMRTDTQKKKRREKKTYPNNQ